MKKHLLLILAVLSCIVSFGQSNYSRGFQNGYRQGYCEGEVNCSFTPPATPVPTDNESADSYKDGFDRGVKMGKDEKQAEKKPTGSMSFWSSWKRNGVLKLYVSGEYVTKFSSYFKTGTPQCGQAGTITITGEPGNYTWKAVFLGDFSTKVWSGTITIVAGQCILQKVND